MVGNYNSYLELESIEAYQSNSSEKELVFNFNSDYISSHLIEVKIYSYNSEDKVKAIYSNDLEFIGKKSAVTVIDFENKNDFYI